MAKKDKEAGPITVDISVMNDGTVSLVFPRLVQQFNASADEMAQLGMNLIKASQVALMNHAQMANAPSASARKM
ncbi:MAG: hypothetical protein V4529_16965 [Gemmatimonadota bacterium]